MKIPQSDPRDEFFDVSSLKSHAIRQAGRSSVLVLFLSAVKLALHLGSTIVLARLIPPSEYGIAALAMPVAVILMNLSQFGLVQPIVQMSNVSHKLVSTLFWVNLGLGTLLGLVMVLLAPAAARFYDEPLVTPVLMVLGASVVFTSLLTQYVAILRRRLQINVIEFGALGAFFGSVVLAIASALAGASYWAVIIQQVAGTILTVVIYAAYVPWRPSAPWRADLRDAKEALAFGGNVVTATLLQQISQALPAILIGRFYAPVDAGLYQRSNTLARLLPARVATPLSAVYIPTMSRLQDDPAAFRKTYRSSIERLDLLLMPAGVVLFTSSDLIVPFVLGSEWAAAAPVLAWLSLILLQNPGDQTFSWALTAAGASWQIRFYGIFSFLILVALLIVIGFERDLVTLVAGLAIGNMCLRLPMHAYLAIKNSHIDLSIILKSYGVDLATAIVAILFITLARNATDSAAILPNVFVIVVILAMLYSVRIGTSPVLRRDLTTALRRIGRAIAVR